jgi:hypothetical protein
MTAMNAPIFSVVMPAYNAERFVGEVKSVLKLAKIQNPATLYQL